MTTDLYRILEEEVYCSPHDPIGKIIKRIMVWHRRERKKWALKKKPEEIYEWTHNPDPAFPDKDKKAEAYNEALADYVKNIKED